MRYIEYEEMYHIAIVFNLQHKPVYMADKKDLAEKIEASGAFACALGESADRYYKMITAFEGQRTNSTLILCLSEKGKEQERFKKELNRLNISFIDTEIGIRELTEEELAAELRTIERNGTGTPDNVSDYIEALINGRISRADAISTGFENMDRLIGGIYPGLYILGAIPSLGKTTFLSQIADQMAADGEHVIFFSLEHSRFEMIEKSILRTGARIAKKGSSGAVEASKLHRGEITTAIREAAEIYKAETGKRLSIIEGNYNCTLQYMSDYVRKYIECNRIKPVIMIDYMQVIQSRESQRSTKDSIDYTLIELKRLSRALDVPVIVISSLNRSNYLMPVDFESFKESGGIEYTADVLMGLQLSAINEELFQKEGKLKEKRDRIREAKSASTRHIQLVCLKNKFGEAGKSCNFEYYPAYNLFEEKTPRNPFGSK